MHNLLSGQYTFIITWTLNNSHIHQMLIVLHSSDYLQTVKYKNVSQN
jgi:hypothetical protein